MLILNKAGKVVLPPGDQVELRAASVVGAPGGDGDNWDEPVMSPMTQTINDNLQANGTIKSTLPGTLRNYLDVRAGASGDRSRFRLYGYSAANPGDYAVLTMRTDVPDAVFSVYDNLAFSFNPGLRSVSCVIEKTRNGSKVRKKHDKAKTPCQRVLDSHALSKEAEEDLNKIYATLNPVKLGREISRLQDRIDALARAKIDAQEEANLVYIST